MRGGIARAALRAAILIDYGKYQFPPKQTINIGSEVWPPAVDQLPRRGQRIWSSIQRCWATVLPMEHPREVLRDFPTLLYAAYPRGCVPPRCQTLAPGPPGL